MLHMLIFYPDSLSYSLPSVPGHCQKYWNTRCSTCYSAFCGCLLRVRVCVLFNVCSQCLAQPGPCCWSRLLGVCDGISWKEFLPSLDVDENFLQIEHWKSLKELEMPLWASLPYIYPLSFSYFYSFCFSVVSHSGRAGWSPMAGTGSEQSTLNIAVPLLKWLLVTKKYT